MSATLLDHSYNSHFLSTTDLFLKIAATFQQCDLLLTTCTFWKPVSSVHNGWLCLSNNNYVLLKTTVLLRYFPLSSSYYLLASRSFLSNCVEAALTRASKTQWHGSLASESLISTTKSLSRINAATTCD